MLEKDAIQQIFKEIEFSAISQGEESAYYWNYHKKRYVFDTQLLDELITLTDLSKLDKIKLLDIGPSFQTMIFRQAFPRLEIDTLVKQDSEISLNVICFDLNDAYYPEKWISVTEQYHVITMLEVIEHLYTSPVQVLKFLNSILKPKGFLIVQTPNGISLPYRLRMLIGKHPFMLINDTRDGHYREYTRKELLKIGAESNFQPYQVFLNNIMSTGSLASKVFDGISMILPRDLRKNITIVFQKQ